MRLATFNVENLFRRPVVLDQPTWAEGREQLNDYTKFNGIICKASYSSADKQWLVDFLDRYEMADRRISEEVRSSSTRCAASCSRCPGVRTRPRSLPAAAATGTAGWNCAAHNVNHIAIENTARVVEALDAEVLAVVEAEDRIALQRFNDSYLVPLGVGFTYNMLIDGNDERGIDVGLYSKHPIRSIHSTSAWDWPGERTFSRDCAEFEIETAAGDTPDGAPLALLIPQTDLKDVMSHPLYLNGNDRRPGTYGSGATSNKSDYILLLHASSHPFSATRSVPMPLDSPYLRKP